MATLGLEISNGVITVIGGLILYAVARALKWTRSVDERLDRIERAELERGSGPPKT